MPIRLVLEARHLKALHSNLKHLVDEVRLVFTPTGLTAKAVDSAQVAMIHLAIKPEAFKTYEVPEDHTFCLDLDKLNDYLKVPGPSDLVEITFDEPKNRLVFKSQNVRRSIGLIGGEHIADPKMPGFQLPCAATVPLHEELAKAVKAAGLVGDCVAFSLDPATGFQMRTMSDYGDSLEFDLATDSLQNVAVQEKVRSQFSHDYLDKAFGNVEGPITFKLGSDLPIILHYGVLGGHGEATFLLAPRIEEA